MEITLARILFQKPQFITREEKKQIIMTIIVRKTLLTQALKYLNKIVVACATALAQYNHYFPLLQISVPLKNNLPDFYEVDYNKSFF